MTYTKFKTKDGKVIPITGYVKKDGKVTHVLEFWAKLQRFHELKDHWTKTSITEKGKQYVKQLKEKYAS